MFCGDTDRLGTGTGAGTKRNGTEKSRVGHTHGSGRVDGRITSVQDDEARGWA